MYSPADPAATVPVEWPLASTYLRNGALSFAGSTMIAWVGVAQMMCADWIVAGYLKGVLGGASVGRAFLEAKQNYVRWINQQGRAPDLADEKTLIEFVLLGDPSIHPVSSAAPAVTAKRVRARPAVPASALAFQERRQRRIVRARMAEQIREVLPVRAAARGVAVARSAKVRPVGNRQSIEYYWSGRRVQDGHKEVRLIKVETDPKGNVLRTAVVHSS